MKCPDCGEENDESLVDCWKCGHKLPTKNTEVTDELAVLRETILENRRIVRNSLIVVGSFLLAFGIINLADLVWQYVALTSNYDFWVEWRVYQSLQMVVYLVTGMLLALSGAGRIGFRTETKMGSLRKSP